MTPLQPAWGASRFRGLVLQFLNVCGYDGGMDSDLRIDTVKTGACQAGVRCEFEDAAVRYHALFDAASDAIFLMQGERFIECNPMTLSVFGCTREQILGQSPQRFSPPSQPDGSDSREAAAGWIRKAVESGPQRFEWLHTRCDGTPFFADVSLNRLDLRGQVFLQSIVRDITQRKVAEDEVRQSEARYRNLFEKASDGIVVCSPALDILDANPSFASMTGFSLEELRGRLVADLYLDVPPGDLDVSIAQVRNGEVADRVRRLATKDGAPVEVEARSKMLADGTILEMYRDVTEARRQEEERHRLARIETLGVIAGGIAHDFNNILTAALGYVELASLQEASRERASESLENAVAAIERARSLTSQLLTFARGGEPVRRVLRLPDLIRESAQFSLRGSVVVFRADLPDDLWPVKADETQISQVFHNLVLNARQAMPSGGEIRILARNIESGEVPADIASEGPFVEVVVVEHAWGIDPETKSRIFDPYFTTKSDGRGLGLATAYRIVQRHGGRLSLAVESGVGCTFTVLLPAAPGAEPKTPQVVNRSHLGHARILVMDDDRDILALLHEVLEHAGYEMVAAMDGASAVDELKRAFSESRPVDLAIVDLTVPGGIGGREALPLMREVAPDLPVIVSSGYSEDPVLSRFREEGFDGACAKPYRINTLLAEIARALSSSQRS